MLNRPFSGDPDPVKYLVPLVALWGLSNVWPALERFMNVLVSCVAIVLVVGTLLLFAWIFWGPLPGVKRKWAEKAEESSSA